MAPAHSSLSSCTPIHIIARQTGLGSTDRSNPDTDGIVPLKQKQDLIDDYLLTTSKWILKSLTGHGSHYILTIVISRTHLPDAFDEQLCRWLHGDYAQKAPGTSSDASRTPRLCGTTSQSTSPESALADTDKGRSPESAPADTNNDRKNDTAYRAACLGQARQAYSDGLLHIPQNAQREALRSASEDGQSVPVTATASHIPITTIPRFRCILCLTPEGCKVCNRGRREKPPTDFPDLSHMWEHIYRCGVYCLCTKELKNYSRLKEHAQECEVFSLVAGPTNRWPRGQLPTYELLVAMNTAAVTDRSSNCAFWDELDEDGKRWINNWCVITEYFYGNSAADAPWYHHNPWPYTRHQNVPSVGWTPRTLPAHNLVETGHSTLYQSQQPYTPDTLAIPETTYALGRANNLSSAGASTISTESSAVFSNIDVMSAAYNNLGSNLRLDVGHTRDTFTEASSSYHPAEPENIPAPPCPSEYGDAVSYWQQTHSVSGQQTYMPPGTPSGILHESAAWLPPNYAARNEGSSDISGQSYIENGIEALNDQGNLDSFGTTANSNLQPTFGDLVPSWTPSGLAYVDPYTRLIRPLESLDKDELITVIQDQYRKNQSA